MTQDSEPPYATRIRELSHRFETAVRTNFAFLCEFGFTKCEAVPSGLDDLRDALVSHRYLLGRHAIDVHFSFLTFQIQAVLVSFETNATCDQTRKPLNAVDLEAWIREHGTKEPRLPWMRKLTLWEEMTRSYKTYAKSIERDMENAVGLLARRLRSTPLLDDVVHPQQDTPRRR